MTTSDLSQSLKTLQRVLIHADRNVTAINAQAFIALSRKRFIAENIFIALLQLTGLLLSTLTSSTFLWLTTGTALAFMFTRGKTIWPGIWMGSFFAYLAAHASISIASECATLFTLQTLGLVWISYYYHIPTLLFCRQRDFFKFIFYSIILTGITSFLLVWCCYSRLQTGYSFLSVALQWWLANLNGIVIVGCLLIAIDAYFPDVQRLKKQNHLVLGLLFATLILLIIFLIQNQSEWMLLVFAMTTFLFVILCSLYYGWFGSLTMMSLLAFFFMLTANFHSVFFQGQSHIIFLQFILLIETIVSLSISIQLIKNKLCKHD